MRGISKQKQLYRGKPVKSLVEGLTKTGGRNNKGRISVNEKVAVIKDFIEK